MHLQLKEDIQVKSNESQREMRKKEKLEKELKQTKTEVESKHSELKAKQSQLQKAQEETMRLEQQLKEQRVGLLSISQTIVYRNGWFRNLLLYLFVQVFQN